jgi:hypothetical protein
MAMQNSASHKYSDLIELIINYFLDVVNIIFLFAQFFNVIKITTYFKFSQHRFLLGTITISGFFYPATKMANHYERFGGSEPPWWSGTICGFVGLFSFWGFLYTYCRINGYGDASERGGALGVLMGLILVAIPMNLVGLAPKWAL